MRKNVIKSILGVALATGVLGAAVFVGSKVEKAPVKEAEAAKVTEPKMRLYIDKNWGGTPYVGSGFGPGNQPATVQSIAADPSNHIPASGTSVVASHSDVQDMALGASGQSTVYCTFFENNVRWAPWRLGQTRQDTGGFSNAVGQNDSFSVNFNNGYIYYLRGFDGSEPYPYNCWDGGKDSYDGHGSGRTVKWYKYTISTEGVFVHYDLDGGSMSGAKDIEHKINTALTLPSAPTRSGYTFMGWEASTNGILNRASTSFTVSEPMTFTAKWHSNTITVVDGNKVRVWVGYNCNGSSIGSLMYNGYGVTTKLWVHQGNGSAGTEQAVIAATGTFYNNSENADDTILTNCPRRFDYFDVPISYFSNQYYLNVQRFNADGSYSGNSSGQIRLQNSNGWAFKVLYVQATWESVPALSGVTANKTNAMFAAVSLSGLHTCSSNVLNGYGGLSYWQSTFLQNTSTSGLSAYRITDYADGDTDYKGSKTKSVTALEKYEYASRALANNSGRTIVPSIIGEGSEQINILVIVITSIALITAIGLFFLIRKRRQDR